MDLLEHAFEKKALKRRTLLRRAEGSKGTGPGQGLEVVGEELVRQGVVYALVCEKEDESVVEGFEMAE